MDARAKNASILCLNPFLTGLDQNSRDNTKFITNKPANLLSYLFLCAFK